jgi:hypothetical protein
MHPELNVDWEIPSTPPGWGGRLERFMGPGKTRAESAVEMLGGTIGFAALAAAAATDDAVKSWSSIELGLAVILALDLVGGVLTNATNSAKRWYHRPGPGRRRARFLFVATHVLHLAVVAFVLLPDGARWWWTHLALLAISTALVELVPVEIKRPTAMAALVFAVAAGQAVAPIAGVLSLVPALFYLKLLVGHMVPEAPLVAARTQRRTVAQEAS